MGVCETDAATRSISVPSHPEIPRLSWNIYSARFGFSVLLSFWPVDSDGWVSDGNIHLLLSKGEEEEELVPYVFVLYHAPA